MDFVTGLPDLRKDTTPYGYSWVDSRSLHTFHSNELFNGEVGIDLPMRSNPDS